MEKWTVKHGDWYKDGIYQYPVKNDGLSKKERRKFKKTPTVVNKIINNIVKIIKPEDDYTMILITEGIYSPEERKRVGKRQRRVNICKIEHYGQADMYGKPAVKTSLVTTNETLYAEETQEQIDELIEEAIKKSKAEKK